MAKLQVTLECAKETYELGKGVGDFVAAVKAALSNGWQAGEDVPAVITAALTCLVPALQGAEKIKDELVADKFGVANAAYVTGQAVIASFLGGK